MEFIRLNQELLDIYAMCESSDEVVRRQNEWLEQAERAQKESHDIVGALPSMEDDNYESDEELELDSFGNSIERESSDKVEAKLDPNGNCSR